MSPKFGVFRRSLGFPSLVLGKVLRALNRRWFSAVYVNIAVVVIVAVIALIRESVRGGRDAALVHFHRLQARDEIVQVAEALGADPADFTEGREAFEAASERLRSVVEEVGDPTFQAVSTSPDIFYVSNPDANPDLRYYRDELGLDIVTPADEDLDEGGYWQTLSWEEADRYDADVALWDARGGSAAPPSPFPPCAAGASPAALQLRDSDLVPTRRGAQSRFWVTWPFFWGGVGGAGVLLLVRFSLRRRTHAYMALPGG